MEMSLHMWKVKPGCGDPPEQWVPREPASGCIGWLVACPVAENPFMLAGGRFDIDAFEDASVGTFSPSLGRGFAALMSPCAADAAG